MTPTNPEDGDDEKGETFGIDANSYALWSTTKTTTAPGALTREAIEAGLQRLLDQKPREPFEIHSPRCTLFSGEDWCSCGTRPWDAILKAELDKQ